MRTLDSKQNEEGRSALLNIKAAIPPSYLRKLLCEALAAYVLTKSTDPISDVVDELLEIEIEAAKLIDLFFADGSHYDLHGSLSQVLSFIKIPTADSKNTRTTKKT